MISSLYLLICVVWLIPLILDIILLINKKRSLAWLFLLVFPGINFWGLIILFLVRPLKTCTNCKKKIQKDARVCPYCATAFGDVLKTQEDIKIEKRKQFKKIIFSIVGVLCICTVFVFAFISSCSNIFSDSIPYKQSIEMIKANPEVMEYIGEDFERKGIFNGSINVSNETGNAAFSYILAGKNGDARVFVEAIKTDNKWTFKKLMVYMSDSDDYIDLLKADSLDSFDFIAL